MTEESDPCPFIYDEASELSYPALPMEKERKLDLKKRMFRKGSLLSILLGPTIQRRDAAAAEHAQSWIRLDLDLHPGEWVEVRPYHEVRATLDGNGSLRGLSFMPEMQQFCGQRLKVAKRVRRIVMETTGELREMKHPVILLEGAACDGSAHHGCDRSCPCFWREQWLRRSP